MASTSKAAGISNPLLPLSSPQVPKKTNKRLGGRDIEIYKDGWEKAKISGGKGEIGILILMSNGPKDEHCLAGIVGRYILKNLPILPIEMLFFLVFLHEGRK